MCPNRKRLWTYEALKTGGGLMGGGPDRDYNKSTKRYERNGD